MPDILIRQVPKKTIALAKRLAEKHRKSLQEELLEVLQEAVWLRAGLWAKRVQQIRERLGISGRRFSDSATSIRLDRAR